MAINFLGDISKGLSALHAKGVLHNDIKPENVLLEGHNNNSGGILKCVITDFGLAQAVSDEILL